jgi:hypothetical protein
LDAGDETLILFFVEDLSNSDTELTRRDPDVSNVGDSDLNVSRALELDGTDGYGTGGSGRGETD